MFGGGAPSRGEEPAAGRGGEPFDFRSERMTPAPALAERVILVVGKPEETNALVEALRAAGARPETCTTKAEALELLRRREFDAMVSDIKLPDGTGYEVFSAARSARAPGGGRPKTVFMTGYGYDPGHNIVRAKGEGLAGVLFNQAPTDELVAQLEELFRPRRSTA